MSKAFISAADPKTRSRTFGLLISAMGILLCAGTISYGDVTVVGAYSNRVSADAQAQGYGIELWKEGPNYFGFFLSGAGTADDMPIGVLDDLRYDPTNKSISFKTKMTVSKSSMDGETWVATRDLYTFEGTLSGDQVLGHLTHTDALEPDHPATQDEIKLNRAKDEEAAMPVPSSYDQWAESARKLLYVRGPKW